MTKFSKEFCCPRVRAVGFGLIDLGFKSQPYLFLFFSQKDKKLNNNVKGPILTEINQKPTDFRNKILTTNTKNT